VVETLLLFPKLQPCRHPVLFTPVVATVQPQEEAVQFAVVPNPETREVTKVLLVPLPALVVAVGGNVAVGVKVLNGEEVNDSWYEFKYVPKDSLATVNECGLLEVVTKMLEEAFCECVTTGIPAVEVVDVAPQSKITSSETDPAEGILNGLSFWLKCPRSTEV
jgi:hypothetical protein